MILYQSKSKGIEGQSAEFHNYEDADYEDLKHINEELGRRLRRSIKAHPKVTG